MHGSSSTMHRQVTITENTESPIQQLAGDYMCITIKCTTSVPPVHSISTTNDAPSAPK